MLRGVEPSFFLRGHPTPLTTAVATGPAMIEYKQLRLNTAHHIAAPPSLIRGVLACVWSLRGFKKKKLLWRLVEYEYERSLWM